MKLRIARQLFNLRDVRNAALGAAVLVGGLGLASVTYIAHLMGQPRLAGIAAGASLIFVLLILVFVVPPLARSASREASQLNLPFEVTPGGAIMMVLIAIVAFSAWNTANNLLFLVLSVMTAAVVVGLVAGSMSLKRLEVKMRFPETIFAGELTPILVNLTNQKRLFPSYSIVVEVRGTEREESLIADDLRALLPEAIANRLSRPPLVRRILDYFVYVPRKGNIETRTYHVFKKRGRLKIRDFELSTKFPFGFLRHRRRLPAKETELVVFPALVPFEQGLDEFPIEVGNVAATKRGSGQDLLSLRDYQPNDDLRRIDWKATARTRQLMVREFAAEDDRKVTIILDIAVPNVDQKRYTLREKIELEQNGEDLSVSERFESAVSHAASLAAHFTSEQAEIRLVIGADHGEFGIGSRHLHDNLKRLAVAEPKLFSEQRLGDFLPQPADLSEEGPDAHYFILTARPVASFSPELAARSNILEF